MKTDLFQSCVYCWVFQICWHIECSTFTASLWDLKELNWNSITSTSFVRVMLPEAHLTPHSRMSGFRWVITPLWLSGSWRSFIVSRKSRLVPHTHNSCCLWIFLLNIIHETKPSILFPWWLLHPTETRLPMASSCMFLSALEILCFIQTLPKIPRYFYLLKYFSLRSNLIFTLSLFFAT